MADKSHRLTDEMLEQMERHLSAIYSRAGKELEKKAAKYLEDFKRLDIQKQRLLKAGKITEAEYKKWRTGKVLYSRRFIQLRQQLAQELFHVNEAAMAYINDQLPDIYCLNYNSLRPKVQGLGGYSFTLVDPVVIKNLASTVVDLLPYREIDPTKDVPWNMKKIQAEVLQGLLQGDSIPEIAKRLRRVSDMNLTSSIRNARTMVTGTECKGRQDSYIQAQKDGIILKREWIATNDSRTRHWHMDLDGVVKGVDEPFENDFGEIMFPGDPTAHPANVYNCRCSIAAKIIGFKKVAK